MDDGAVLAVITPSIERSVRGASHKMAAEHQHGRNRQEQMTRIRQSAPNTLICCSHVFETRHATVTDGPTALVSE